MIAQETAAQTARPSNVAEWEVKKQRILYKTQEEYWKEATPEEQRNLVALIFPSISATPVGVTFDVRDLEGTFALSWHVCHREVAGPGFEPGTP